MSKQHSPGPWAPAPLSPVDILGPDEAMLAMSRYGMNGISQEQAVANARLIAAAPELLVALQALLPHVPGHLTNDLHGRPWIEQARAVIAKATGEQT